MTETDDTESTPGRMPWRGIAAVLGLFAILFGALAIYVFQTGTTPANDSADVGFARDMSVHHAQAVEMASIVYRRTEDPEIERIALDIGTTQQFQIGMMTGWLDIWGRTVSSDLPLMGWMGDYDMSLPSPPPGIEVHDSMPAMDHSHDAGGTEPLMPGMATQTEVDELHSLPPDQMDIRFLQLMIRHHQGGVMMAHAALEMASDEHVLNFAQHVIDTQDAEIATMIRMLETRMAGAPQRTPSAAATPAPALGNMPAASSPTGEGD